ncbi:GDCCVxC domain-containing (seleno)protein [Polynucleobacter sp. MG-28-Ekke-A2]|uniref:GDCCVxC domain-containing (seleno)protein n=1 Tax=unclassified Polynucleobacter TaxID=2640945 RepID=UPI0027E3AB37|nr:MULTISPECIES: GDCCVxC domain-containing (seleno)protein [unclassified Polynucleobacter]MEA9602543.1 GDCCVxC domain-containing (seleno)protein [Polynucleobacter sp. MG-28-Ekke-A2]
MNKTNYFQSIVTCPHCQASELINAEEGAQHLYRCRSCSAILKPKSGDCCILCSFGNRDCSSSEQNLAA